MAEANAAEAPDDVPKYPAVDREQIETFMKTCIEQMRSDEMRETLKDKSAGRPGLKLVEMQSAIWQDLGVTVEAGRKAVTQVEKNFPDDNATLVALRNDFTKASEDVYLQCLEDRQPAELNKEAKLDRDIVLEFCEASSLKLDTEEVKDRMKRHIEEHGTMPDDIITEVNDDIMKLLGVDPTHAAECFTNLGVDFKDDTELGVALQRWKRKAQHDCLVMVKDFQQSGGTLNVANEVKNQLLDMIAKEQLDKMTPQERGQLLQKNDKRVQIFANLPPEARNRQLDRMSWEEKVELAKSQILLGTYLQARKVQEEKQKAEQAALAAKEEDTAKNKKGKKKGKR